jgi:hypothetical protein
MSQNLVDYIVVCGSPPNAATSNLPRRSVSRYIVDVVVVFPDKYEKVPPGYERIRLTPGGKEVDLNTGKFWRTRCHVAVKYGYNDCANIALPSADTPSKELPISEIAAYNGKKNATLENGWTTIQTSVTGRDANINVGSGSSNEIYITVKRLDPKGQTKSPVVTHLTVIDKYYNETCPVGYLPIELNLNLNSSGHKLYFCTKSLPYVSDSQRIVPALLERFPRKDKKRAKLQLPPSIEQFCMPLGVQVKTWQPHQVPLPDWHPFVLTEGSGTKMFGAALLFWEPYDCSDGNNKKEDEERNRETKEIDIATDTDPTNHAEPLITPSGTTPPQSPQSPQSLQSPPHPPHPPHPPQTPTSSPTSSPPPSPPPAPPVKPPHHHQEPKKEYRTKCVAILSHYSFFNSFKKALKLMYRIALGGCSFVPIERYISNLVLSVPLPSPGTNVVLDWGLGDSNAIVFSRPEREDLPMIGVSFLPLFHMLSVPSIVSCIPPMMMCTMRAPCVHHQ